MKLVYLHGHGASATSFNFIRSELVCFDHDAICLEYDSKHGFAANLASMAVHLESEPDVFFVAHSLGGLYALHLAGKLGDRAAGAVTMATPYGGSESAIVLNCFWPQQVYRDIHPTARPIRQGRNIDLPASCRWTAIISTKGHSQLMTAANDGVVTTESMRARRGARFVEVESNHHEVIQSRRSVDIIKAALRDILHKRRVIDRAA